MGLFLIELVAAVSALWAPHLLGSILTADRADTLPKEYRPAYLVDLAIVLVGALMFIVAGRNMLASGAVDGVLPWLPIGVFLCYLIAVVDADMFLILLEDPRPPEVAG